MALGLDLDPSALARCFAEVDEDNSGTITGDEIKSFFGDKLQLSDDAVQRLLWDMDQDGDGQVSLEELQAALTARSTFCERAHGSSNAEAHVNYGKWGGYTGLLFEAIVASVVPQGDENFSDLRRAVLVEFDFSPGGFGRICHERRASPASGCTIARAEHRGLRLSSLRALTHHIQRRCQPEAWMDVKQKPLEDAAAVSMYDTVAYAIKPATEKLQCSFVELVTDAAAPPSWFCSHWWGGAKKPSTPKPPHPTLMPSRPRRMPDVNACVRACVVHEPRFRLPAPRLPRAACPRPWAQR